LELSFLENLILGLISGFAEVLPVSAQAHRLVILKILGHGTDSAVLRLMIHLGTVGALYFYNKGYIVRMMRARRLARVPKNRRKRPLDTEALTDFRFMLFATIPVILGFLLYGKISFLSRKLIYVAAFLLINGIILYVPQYLPGSNKQSGALSRVDSLYFGLGGVLGMLPGVSSLGSFLSIGSVRGFDMEKTLTFALLLNIPVNLGFAVYDLMALLGAGSGSLAFGSLVYALFAGAAAFGAIILGIHLLKKIMAEFGSGIFSFYCWTVALLTFLLYLAVA
jgi:undecaprenyl-diphosphatase